MSKKKKKKPSVKTLRLAIGRTVRQQRVKHKLTQSLLGKKLGLTQAQLSRLENGHYTFKLELLFKLSNVFGINIAQLMKLADL